MVLGSYGGVYSYRVSARGWWCWEVMKEYIATVCLLEGGGAGRLRRSI